MKYFYIFSFILFSCGAAKGKTQVKNNDTTTLITTQENMITSKDTIIQIGNTDVWIQSPAGEIKADILVLPGWNFVKEKICQESDFCKKALAQGYRLILPEMLKSVYASHYFEETRNDYKAFLTLTWVTDTMIPALQKNVGVFTGKNNYIHGISTGSRGAALVHLATGDLFTKVVLLSGDFDQTKMTTDNLMKNTYGPYGSFKQRWETLDNPSYLSSKWTADMYIAHGTADDVVPVEQSKLFADKIKREHPNCKVVQHFPSTKHDFGFWGGETEAILLFLAE